MQRRYRSMIAAMAALSVLAGCGVKTVSEEDDPYRIGYVPDNILAITAPQQDLTTARLDPADNCYWYQHQGPVETTLVPLRSVGGGAICIVRQPAT